MKTILTSILTRMVQPASWIGYVTVAAAAAKLDLSADFISQIAVILGGVAGCALVLLNTKFKND